MAQAARPAVLITGAAKRIGRALALSFADAGYDVAIHYKSSEADALTLAKLVKGRGTEADIFPADLCDPNEAAMLVPAVLKRFPKLSVVINSASMFLPSSMTVKGLPALEENWRLHVAAPWVITAEFVRVQKRGVVINILDTKVTGNTTKFSAYLLSKKALAELTQMQAVQFAPLVRVNAVAPGAILPPDNKGTAYLKGRVKDVPLKKPGCTDDVVDAVHFLVRSQYVTGQVLFVDGGEHLIKA